SKEFDIALKLTKLALHSKNVKLFFASSFSFQSSSAALGDFNILPSEEQKVNHFLKYFLFCLSLISATSINISVKL
ncbi:hypothetical protein, partial [Exiguobacterium sp. B2(2022)]|uniref:hypothetical protein n=1 Tax=Exiguobacterium sp. B2(2022) TaxID=2992755 RepID=UPI00237BAA70